MAIPVGDGRVFVTRHLAADALERHPDWIRRRATPALCCGTARDHVLFYDMDELEKLSGDTPKRRKLPITAC